MMYVAILIRLLAATSSNVWQKQMTNRKCSPFAVIVGMYGLTAVVGLPILWLEAADQLTRAFWTAAILAGVLDGVGNLFQIMALKRTDLSVFGPLNAFKALFGALAGLILLNEVPSVPGIIGMVVIVAGSYLLAPPTPLKSGSRWMLLLKDAGVWLRFLSIGFFAVGAPYLKVSVLNGPISLAYYVWIVSGLAVSTVGLAILRSSVSDKGGESSLFAAANVRTLILMAAANAVMQLSTLYVMRQTQVGYALALFQLGMLFQVFAGRVFFKEKHLVRRVLACVIMILGSLLVLHAS